MLPILNQSFWRDEAFSALLSEKSPLQIVLLTAKDQSPPLYLLLLHYWMRTFGTTEAAIRGLSFFFHIGSALITFFLAKKLLHSSKAAVLVSIAVLCNPFLLEYAFEARAYSMLVFLTLIPILCLVYKKYFLAGLTLALAMLTHNFALFSVAGVGIWWIYENKLQIFSRKKETIALFGLPFAAFLGWGIVLWNQWVKLGHGFWIKPVTSAAFLETFQKFSTSDLSFPAAGFLFLFSFILSTIGITYFIWNAKKEDNSYTVLLSLAAFFPIGIVYAISLFFAPIYLERYLIETIIPLILLISFGIRKLYLELINKRVFVIVIITAYMLLLFQTTEQLLQMRSKPSINWAVEQVISRAKPGDIIVPKDVLNFLETKWYVRKLGGSLPVYAYSPSGKIPFYIGSVVFEHNDIIQKVPVGKRIWEIEPDGGYKLLPTGAR